MLYDPIVWAVHRGISLRDGVRFTMKNMPYLVGMLNCGKPIRNCKKGAQVCATTLEYLDAVHACYYRRYKQNIMYMMPTVTAVERLSKVSFDPIFTYNPWLMKKGSTNTVMCKEINGRSIVMVGAQSSQVGSTGVKDTANLRSIPCDCIKRDEIDLQDMDVVYISKQRLKRSEFGHEVNFGSPTYPGYGIDALYEGSDQRKWQIKCGSCGKYTCLVESFPNSIILSGDRWIRACVHCSKEIFVRDGSWVSEYPDRREAGFWLDGLLSPFANLEEYMYQYHNIEGANMAEFMRSTLGYAVVEAENQLSDTAVLSRCSGEANQMVSVGETCMGVDVGKTIHAVVGIRTGRESYEILNVSRLNNLQELHDLAQKMNVHSCVIDSGPHDFGVLEFQKSEPYTIYLCNYSEQMPGKPKFNSNEGLVKCNRNEWCDKVHTTFIDSRIRIPRSSVEIKEYALEMTKTAKRIVTNKDTGMTKPRWIKLGADHYYHATLYFLLAASRSSVRQRGRGKVNRPQYAVSKWN